MREIIRKATYLFLDITEKFPEKLKYSKTGNYYALINLFPTM